MLRHPRKLKFSRQQSFDCGICRYKTDKRANYLRHIGSDRHSHKTFNFDLGSFDLQQADDNNLDQVDLDVDRLWRGEVGQYTEPASSDGSDLEEIRSISSLDYGVGEDEDVTFSESDDENDVFDTASKQAGAEWYPFESKIHFLLCTLYSSKTHRVSDEVMSYIIFILKECGCHNVPSLSRIKNYLQKKVDMEDMIQKYEDVDGNISYIVKPSSVLKLQLANPEVSKQISRYPSTENSSASNIQASGSKWREMEFHWAQSKAGVSFVKGSFVTFQLNGEKVHGKSLQFLDNLKEDRMYVEVDVFVGLGHGYLLDVTIEDNCLVKFGKVVHVPIDDCKEFILSTDTKFKEYKDGILGDIPREISDQLRKTSPLWKGLPIVSTPINIFMDDMSANQSRRWSALHSIQGQLSGLDVQEKNRGKNVFLLGVADKMDMLELMKPICQDIQTCKQFGIEAFDAMTKKKVVLTSDISLIVSDYEMTSLACNHLGPSANKFCPKCLADETDPFKKWTLRTDNATKRTLDRLKIVRDKTSLQRETGVKLYDNCLWEYIDPHRDTPIGILHFLYLGLAKHLIKADDMERHGHVLQFSEDAFEKNHRTIRSSILHQNGHARSRDTALQFANCELMAHVIVGGFFPDSETWSSASNNVLTYGNEKATLNYLGMSKDQQKPTGYLKQLINKKLNDVDLSHIEVQLLQCVLNCGGNPNVLRSKDFKVQDFAKGCTQAGETAQIGSFVLYMDENENNKVGQICKFLRLLWKGNCHHFVLMKKAQLVTNCNRFQYITSGSTVNVVPLISLQHLIHTIHDCKVGKCHLREGFQIKRIEQEDRSVKSKFLKHSSHDVYIINKFRLTHTMDKFAL